MTTNSNPLDDFANEIKRHEEGAIPVSPETLPVVKRLSDIANKPGRHTRADQNVVREALANAETEIDVDAQKKANDAAELEKHNKLIETLNKSGVLKPKTAPPAEDEISEALSPVTPAEKSEDITGPKGDGLVIDAVEPKVQPPVEPSIRQEEIQEKPIVDNLPPTLPEEIVAEPVNIPTPEPEVIPEPVDILTPETAPEPTPVEAVSAQPNEPKNNTVILNPPTAGEESQGDPSAPPQDDKIVTEEGSAKTEVPHDVKSILAGLPRVLGNKMFDTSNFYGIEQQAIARANQPKKLDEAA